MMELHSESLAPGSTIARPVTSSHVNSTTLPDSNTKPSGPSSHADTSQVKGQQSDKLEQVKKRTLLVVIIADLVLLGALAYQMVWLNQSLHSAFHDRITNLMGFYRFSYNEIFNSLALGASVYSFNTTAMASCQALAGDSVAQSAIEQYLAHDIRMRNIGIALVTDVAGTVVTAAGTDSAKGYQFNPNSIITDFYAQYPQANQQLHSTVMVPSTVLAAMRTEVRDAVGDYRPDLQSWRNLTESLARLTVSPLYCGTGHINGYLIMGDLVTPRKYDVLNRLVMATDSALVALMVRNSDGYWQLQNTYNKAGAYGFAPSFPDLLPYYPDGHLGDLYAAGTFQTELITFGDVNYIVGSMPIPKPVIGTMVAPSLHATEAVLIHAEPEHAVEHTVSVALLWHVPFGVFMTILSFVSLHYTHTKFIHPMKLLIESVRKRKMKEFNDHIRVMKTNRTTMYLLLFKTLLVQAVLLGLIFANRYLIRASIEELTSATTQGLIGPYVQGAHARATALYLGAWTGSSNLADTIATRNVTDEFREGFAINLKILDSEVMYLITEDSLVVASTYPKSEGRTFPEIGVMKYYQNQTSSQWRPFITLTHWQPFDVNAFTPENFPVTNSPAFIRMEASPVTTSGGDLVGALICIRIFNGKTSVWGDIVNAFGTGYGGLYEWDRYHQRFAALTSVWKTTSTMEYGVDISQENVDIFQNAIKTSYQSNGMLVQVGVQIRGQSNTLSVSSYFSDENAVLSPLMINGYLVTAVSQEQYDTMEARQTVLQAVIMAIEWLASTVALVCTYWPMKQFLDDIERAFRVPSMSMDQRRKMEERAAALVMPTAPVPVFNTKPDTIHAMESIQSCPDTSP